MSVFGNRLAYANTLIDNEYADTFVYEPMREVVNGSPEPDDTRQSGRARGILLQPGMVSGSGWSLAALHERSTSEPTLFFMARGRLADVRRFDRFFMSTHYDNVDKTGTRCYEVGDGPRPVGFGRYLATLVEIDPLQVNPLHAGGVVSEEEIPF